MSSADPTASIRIHGSEYNWITAQQPPKVRHMTVTMEAVRIHCLAVKPWAKLNWDPFSTMYWALQTLHVSASGLSAL